MIILVLLYGSETWQMYAGDSRKLNAFHRSCLHKIIGVTSRHKVKNEEVMRRTGESEITETIQR